VTYFFSSLVAVVLPWRSPELWRLSPTSRVRILGMPVVPVAGLVTMALLGFNLYEWLSSSAYGVNAPSSLIFMGSLYVLAAAVYAYARWARQRQGIDLRAILRKIPDE
jgi:hypothetical protein